MAAFVISCAVSFPFVWYAFEWFERSRAPPRRPGRTRELIPNRLPPLPISCEATEPAPRDVSPVVPWFVHSALETTAAIRDALPAPVKNWVVMDLETTGLGSTAEITEIAIVDSEGTVLLDQLVMPKGRIPKVVTSKTGIDRKLLKGCPQWPEIEGRVRALLSNRAVITYNAQFDIRILQQTARKWATPPIHVDGLCAMLAYAEYRGVKHPWRKGEYKWHKQAAALQYEGIAHFRQHRALADAKAARELVLKMIDGSQAWRARHAIKRIVGFGETPLSSLLFACLASSLKPPPNNLRQIEHDEALAGV